MLTLPISIRQCLRNLGFSDNDVTLLAFLFRVQKASLKDISSNTGLSFSTAEYALNNLSHLKLVKPHSDETGQHYHLCSTDEFLAWIEEKSRKQSEQFIRSQDEMALYFKGLQSGSWKPEFKYYEGIEGIIAIYEDMLQSGEDILAWYDIKVIQEFLGDYLQEYIKRRIEKGIKTTSILPDNPVNRKYAEMAQSRNVKFVKNLPINGEIRIYDNKVAVITFDKKNPVGFVQESKVVTDMYRAIFQYSWGKED